MIQFILLFFLSLVFWIFTELVFIWINDQKWSPFWKWFAKSIYVIISLAGLIFLAFFYALIKGASKK